MIKEGDFVFICGNSPFARMVRIVETGKVPAPVVPSHVAIVSSVYANKIILIEGGMRGVRLASFDKYDKYKKWVKRIRDPKDVQKGLVWLNEQIGTFYDFSALWGIFLRSFVRVLGPKVYNRVKKFRNLLENRQRFFCSELAAYFGMECGRNLTPHSPSVTTPFDIWGSGQLYDV